MELGILYKYSSISMGDLIFLTVTNGKVEDDPLLRFPGARTYFTNAA